MFLWLSVIDKKVAHPHEIQNTFVYNTVVFELHSFARTLFDHFPLIVDFRSAVRLPYDYRSVANTDTRFAPNILGRACFFPYGAQFGRRARKTTGKYAVRRQIKVEDAIIGSAHRRWRVCVARYDVAILVSTKKSVASGKQQYVSLFLHRFWFVWAFFFRWRSIVRICTNSQPCMDMCVVS